MCFQAPISSRKRTEEGVREEQRLENWVVGREKPRVGVRDWDSMRAILREAVAGEEPTCELLGIRTFGIAGNVRRAARRLNPAGPPPTQTTSYISGCVVEVA